MRACIEGYAPSPANKRLDKETLRPVQEAYKKRYSAPLLEAIDWAMEIDPLLRPQSVDELMLRFEIEVPELPAADAKDTVLEKWASHLPWKR